MPGDNGDEKTIGLECRRCGCRHFLVYYTRGAKDSIRRVRHCRHCGLKLVTTERASLLGNKVTQ